MKKVSIYSTPTCSYCNMAKALFKANNIAYDELDVASNLEKHKEMVAKSGQLGVPVIVVDGEVIVGFDKNKLTKLLDLK